MKKIIGRIYILIIMLFLYLPIFALIVLSFNESKSMSVWGGFSLRWYQELFRSRIMMGAIANTFSIAILAALIATVVGTFAVLGMAAMKPRTQNVLLGLNNIPMLNADIVTGIALMLFFLMVGAPRGYMTILFSHATFCIPYVILSVRPRVNKNTDRLFEAALDLGASERYAFRKIVLPELRPGIMSGFLLSFTMSVDDFIITYFTRGAGINTISTLIYSEVKVGIRPSLFALSTIELPGDGVKHEIDAYIRESVKSFAAQGIIPKLAVIRAGDDDGQKYYENAILRQSNAYGIETQAINFTSNIGQALVEVTLQAINEDESVHGIILLRPLPSGIDSERLRTMLNPAKDVDAITDISIAELFAGKDDAFFACTAEACMEVMRYHGIDPAGRKVTILGRSLTVGKPLAIMMLNADATVTICHSRTPEEDQIKACRDADIVVLATGRTQGYGSKYFRDGQVVLDVGTGTGRDGKMHGDLDIEEIRESGEISDLAYTPVPGGIGRVTTAILLRNIIKAAKKG